MHTETFETDFGFEQMPLVIGGCEYGLFDGTARLEGELASHDYGFEVVSIELDGNLVGNASADRTVVLHEKCDDPFLSELFKHLAKAVKSHPDAASRFYTDLAEYREAA